MRDEDALFAFLEESLVGIVTTAPAPCALTVRALELPNHDWTEEQAPDELVQLARADRQALKMAYYQLQVTLLSPLVDVPGVRACRILHHAFRQASGR